MNLDSVGIIFNEPQNVTFYGGGTCGDEVGEKCRQIYWRVTNIYLASDDQYSLCPTIDWCVSSGSALNYKVSVTGECPVKYYEELNYADSFSAVDEKECSLVHAGPGKLENASVYAYFRPFNPGAAGVVTLSSAGKPEEVVRFTEKCVNPPCGLYQWFVRSKSDITQSFQVCAETNSSELIIGEGGQSVKSWWMYYNYTKTSAEINGTLDIRGRPKVTIIQLTPGNKILETDSFIVKGGISATCGNITDMEVNLTPANWTAIYVTSVTPFKVNLENGNSRWFEWSAKAGNVNLTSTDDPFLTNITVNAKYINYTSNRTEDMEISYNSLKCEVRWQRCDGICKKLPNCTLPCGLGIICQNGQLRCVLRECGSSCPNDPSRLCDAYGFCLTRTTLGMPCDCDPMCFGAYLSGPTCFFQGSCSGRVCQYLSKNCDAVCKNTGCCGDKVCDATESCETCVEDCSCDDNNPCTSEYCSNQVCIYENVSCGVTCHSGICDGRGQCRSDACCSDEDCTDVECKTSKCMDFTCIYTPQSCANCTNGYCLNGTCSSFQKLGEECKCENACGQAYLCVNSQCTSCGNKVCDPGECLTCPLECDLVGCAREIIEEHKAKIGIALLLIILVLLFGKTMLPSIKETLKKLKSSPPPETY